jgi:hypothetical protein
MTNRPDYNNRPNAGNDNRPDVNNRPNTGNAPWAEWNARIIVTEIAPCQTGSKRPPKAGRER